MRRYSQYAICPRCQADADAGADIEPEHAVRYIWGTPASYWGPAECDDASETAWQCLGCHDGGRGEPFTAAEIAQLDAAASDYEEDAADD